MPGSQLAIAVTRVAFTQDRGKQGQREGGQTIKLLLHYCHLKQTRHRKQMLARGAPVAQFCHCMDMSLSDMVSCWRLPNNLFDQFLRDYCWHVSTRPVVRASRWPTSPQHHLQVTKRSLEYGTGAGTVLGAPRAPLGERGIFWLSGLSEYPLRCDYRLCRSAKSIQVVWSRF